MKKFIKAFINILLSCCIAAVTVIGTGNVAHAAQATPVFIPFRSDLVKYITTNSHNKDTVIQSQWIRLFKEEAGNSKWSDTYYGDFTNSKGKTQSSKGVRVTNNPNFDPFLYGTITSNKEFVSNWINNHPNSFKTYCFNYKGHAVFCDAIVDLTRAGYMLGSGYKQSNNIFQYGFTKQNYWDLRVLAILASSWNQLSYTQQNWCKTYVKYLVPEYVAKGSAALGARNNNEALYNLMSISDEGFKSTKGQEFFNYANSSNEVRIGDLLKNVLSTNGLSGDIRSGDAYTEINLNGVFGGDADCDYNGASLGDGDYDWLAYTICFSGNSIWSRFRTFVDNNSSTSILKKEWLLRYYALHADSGEANGIREAISKQGQSEKVNASIVTMPGCGKSCLTVNDESFNCFGHSVTSTATVSKPVGVESFTFESSTNCVGYKWKVTDTSTGNVLSENMESYSSSPTITLDASAIWSNSISVYVETFFKKNGEHIGRGSCNASQKSTDIVWTYVVLGGCEVHGHDYEYSYSFNSDHSQCTAEGICRGCGDKKTFIDSTISKTQDSSFYIYTADFAHTNVPGKSDRIQKTTGTFTYKADNKNAISGTTHDVQKISKKYTGAGFTLDTSVSGKCSLVAGYIKPGAKSITVSASGSQNTFTLYSQKGAQLKTITLVSDTQGETKYTFDVSSISDANLEDSYLVVNMYSKNHFSSGMRIGDTATSTSTINFNYITIKY